MTGRSDHLSVPIPQDQLADNDIQLEISDAALDHLGEAGIDPVCGWRSTAELRSTRSSRIR